MLIKVIVVGKLKDRAIQTRCDEFAKWLASYGKIEVIELPDSSKDKESEAILKALAKDKSRIFVLSEEGSEYTSRALASKLEAVGSKLTFVIGGPYGMTQEVKNAADELWSLSKLTFTHEIARLLLFEQLFRAANIQSGGHYHND